MARLYPSILAAPVLSLRKVIEDLDDYVDGYHIDIMDGHFVNQIAFGPAVVNEMARVTTKQLWVHAMVTNPRALLEQLQLPAGSLFSFHIELDIDFLKLINYLKEKKIKVGLAINPKTSLDLLEPFLGSIDQVLIMSVNPGQSGQLFLPESVEKISVLAMRRRAHNYAFKIGIDGGITESWIKQLQSAGIDDWVIGSDIFKTSDPVQATQYYYNLVHAL